MDYEALNLSDRAEEDEAEATEATRRMTTKRSLEEVEAHVVPPYTHIGARIHVEKVDAFRWEGNVHKVTAHGLKQSLRIWI